MQTNFYVFKKNRIVLHYHWVKNKKSS